MYCIPAIRWEPINDAQCRSCPIKTIYVASFIHRARKFSLFHFFSVIAEASERIQIDGNRLNAKPQEAKQKKKKKSATRRETSVTKCVWLQQMRKPEVQNRGDTDDDTLES